MNCPLCNVALQLSERQGIEIDYCPKCRGVWLDRGELDKIIERAAAEMPPVQAQPAQNPGYYDKRHGGGHHDDHHQYKRRKSLLEQLFD